MLEILYEEGDSKNGPYVSLRKWTEHFVSDVVFEYGIRDGKREISPGVLAPNYVAGPYFERLDSKEHNSSLIRKAVEEYDTLEHAYKYYLENTKNANG
jgi:hypothetical protein